MNPIKYFLLLILALPSCVLGQGRIMYGAMLGVNLASQDNTPERSSVLSLTFDRSTGYLLGYQIGYFHKDGFSFAADLLFDKKGFQVRDSSVQRHYLELTLLAKYPVFTGRFEGHVFAGPNISLPLPGDEDAPFDYGVCLGVGITYSSSKWVDLYCEAAYAYGLRDFSAVGNTAPPLYKEYSRDIRIYAGFLFSKQ